MNWTIISAVNNEDTLRSCLLSSPDARSAAIILQKGYASAARAYNDGLEKAGTDLVVLAHQDVYFPPGWLDSLKNTLELLAIRDPEWGVLGVWGGIDDDGSPGYMYWTGVNGAAGKPFPGVREVRSLDEVVLILRKSSGLRFDERLSGYHFYGTDICLEANRRGRKCYIFSGFCVHNTNVYDMLPLDFWRGYLFMRKKWAADLPIHAPCIEITRSCWPMVRWNAVRATNILLRRHKSEKRISNPAVLYEDFVRRGYLVPTTSSPR
jgi:glycosyltransferase involved in cell wall biosynthesis